MSGTRTKTARQDQPRRRLALESAGGVMIVALALGACKTSEPTSANAATGSSPAAATRAPTTRAAPTTKALTEQEKVVEAYRTLWDEIVAANNPPNPDSPALSTVAAAEMLDRTRAQIRANKAAGKGTRFASPSKFKIMPSRVTVDATDAELNACMTDDLVSFNEEDGQPLDELIVSKRLVARLTLTDGVWRTVSNEFTATFEGVEECPR